MPSKVFSYPDHVFPTVTNPFPGLPLAPLEKISKIQATYQALAENTINKSQNGNNNTLSRQLTLNITDAQEARKNGSSTEPVDVDIIFKWARETVDFAENQYGLAPEVVDMAVDIIALVSESPNGITRFKGAALYIVGVWTLFGLFGRKVNVQLALELFKKSSRAKFPRALYRIGSEVSFSRSLLWKRSNIYTSIVRKVW